MKASSLGDDGYAFFIECRNRRYVITVYLCHLGIADLAGLLQLVASLVCVPASPVSMAVAAEMDERPTAGKSMPYIAPS